MYQWIDQYNYYCDFEVKNIIICANKNDLEDERKVSKMEIKQWCESMNCDYVEISVLNDQGVDDLVSKVITKCLALQQVQQSATA